MPDNFWEFFKKLAIEEKEVIYPCGIDATLIDEGNIFVRVLHGRPVKSSFGCFMVTRSNFRSGALWSPGQIRISLIIFHTFFYRLSWAEFKKPKVTISAVQISNRICRHYKSNWLCGSSWNIFWGPCRRRFVM